VRLVAPLVATHLSVRLAGGGVPGGMVTDSRHHRAHGRQPRWWDARPQLVLLVLVFVPWAFLLLGGLAWRTS
jgi:hypothetical protein